MQPQFSALRQTIAHTEAEMVRFRQLVINVVLATDIVDKELKNLRNNRWEIAFSEAARLDDSPHEHMNRKATIVLEHLIQASDVAHTMQHWHIYRKWNEVRMGDSFDNARDCTVDVKDKSNSLLHFVICFPLSDSLKSATKPG